MPRKISHKLSKTVRPGFGGLQTAQEPDPIGSDANKARFALARENAFDLVMLDLTTRPLIGCSFYLRGVTVPWCRRFKRSVITSKY